MKLLAWDTSSKVGSIAALEFSSENPSDWAQVRLVAEMTLNVEATHSEQLLWAVDQILKACRWDLKQVDLFGIGAGPGSFTGLRIGLTTARTLAQTLNRPLLGVSSLAALARPIALHFSNLKTPPLVIAATDACKGELFALWGGASDVLKCFSEDQKGWGRVVKEQVITPDVLIESVQKKLKAKQSWVVVGEARQRYQEIWNSLPKKSELSVPFPFWNSVQGRYIGVLAWEAFCAGLAKNPLEVHPRYLRASDAELKLKSGVLPQAPARQWN